MSKKAVLIISISSDIGLYLAKKYLEDGMTVIGTYRKYGRLKEINSFQSCHLFPCDITNKKSIRDFLLSYKNLKLPWQTFISAVSDPRPLTSFFNGDFEDWSKSVHINAIEQLRILHDIYPYRIKNSIPNVVFFAAGGVQKAVLNFSALTISKMMLIKMSEYLDSEEKNLNIFTVAPGWTKTKTHDLIINDPFVSKDKIETTKKYFRYHTGTSLEDIYRCIKFLCQSGKRVASGRNIFIPDDPWREPKRKKLLTALRKDNNMYKLRRYRNDFLRK